MAAGELRRKDREMSAVDTEECLAKAQVGRVGTVGPEGMPYVVPMNFAYDAANRTIFLHCATSGHLLDNLAVSPLACFEVDEPGEVIATGPDACSTSQIYRSAICFGRARIVDHGQEKERALNLLVHKYVDQLMPDRSYNPGLATLDATTVIVLSVERITGKQRSAPGA